MLPQSNAILDSIGAPGQSEDYDRPATGSTPLFVGPADAYYRETVVTSYSRSGGGLDKNKDVQLIIPADLPGLDATQIKTGFVVTFTYRGTTHARRIQEYTNKWMPGVPNPTIRLHLDTAAVDVEEVGV